MSLATLTRVQPDPSGSRSKVKYFGDFKKELQKTLEDIEILLAEEIPRHFTLDSIILGTYDMKIRVRDIARDIEKIVSVILRYHRDDEKYGNIHIEIMVSEVSQKSRSHFLGKYLVSDRKKILPRTCSAVIEAIRQE